MMNLSNQSTNQSTNQLINQPSLTIVSVTGHQDYAQNSAYAIARSYKELQPKIANIKCLLISPKKPVDFPDYIEHVACKPFDYFNYNFFVLYALDDLIQTDFALIVQHDGWVIDGNNWQDEFFNYDYIGGPILNIAEFENGKFLKRHPHTEWRKYCDDMPENMREIQNGGFSLRSKKMLGAPRKLGLKIEFHPPEHIDIASQPVEIKWDDNIGELRNEDQFLCAYHRLTLENYGIKFAPMNLAALFGIDRLSWQLHHKTPLEKVMGIHSTGYVISSENKALFVAGKTTREKLLGFTITKLLVKKGFKISVPADRLIQ